MSYLRETVKRVIRKSSKKNSRLLYHIASIQDLAKPRFLKKLERKKILRAYEKLPANLKKEVDRRVALYNKLAPNTLFNFNDPDEAIYKLSDLKLHATFNGARSRSNYCYDSLKYLRCYSRDLNGCFTFGDVTWVPHQPSFVKSRPIAAEHSNSVLLPLNRIRHFNFIHDKTAYLNKIDMLIGISYAKQPHRQEFLRQHFTNPLCRLGSARHFNDERKIWNVEHISIDEQLKYKFILCLEGHDVATNLKWVMSSNSIAVMPKPTYESWFMESTLKAGEHYIEIAADYSDLDEKLQYYIDHPEQALRIIDAAHQHISQFKNKKIENIISMRVVEEYFKRTAQECK